MAKIDKLNIDISDFFSYYIFYFVLLKQERRGLDFLNSLTQINSSKERHMKNFGFLLFLLMLCFSVPAYSAEDASIDNPPVDSNSSKYFYSPFYNTLKMPATPPVAYNDWVFNGTSTQKNWYNEKDWLGFTNTSNIPATVYVYLYKPDGSLYNNTADGIPITIQPFTNYSNTIDQFYTYISSNWDGDSPLSGFVKVVVPNNYGGGKNGSITADITHVLFKGNDTTDPFDPNAHTTSYLLPLTQVSINDNVHNLVGLCTFAMYINKNFNNNEKLDVDAEVVNLLKISNTSETPMSVNVTYYDGLGGTTPIGTTDIFSIPARGSVSYAPTSPGYGLNAAALQFLSDPNRNTLTYLAVVTLTAGKPKAAIGQTIELRRQSGGAYDSITENMFPYTN
jgi:hypothetical protein